MYEVSRHNYNLMILEILRKYSDEGHKLTQQEIIRIAKQDYDTDIDRRSVKSNVEALAEVFDIEMNDGRGYALISREFEDAELRMLIDSVLFSKTITTRQAQNLIEKLEHQSNVYFKAKVSHVSNLPELQHSDNRQVLYSVQTINDAIDANRKMSFTYNRYGTDFQLHPVGSGQRTASPYQMVANNGRYYVLCYDDFHEDVSYLRIDRMTDVTILRTRRKPMKEVPGMEHGLDLPKHMAEHFYMFGGEAVPVTLRAKKAMMGDLIDWFGKDFSILREDEDTVTVRVTCNENSVFYWALQYGMGVEVLSPESLRGRIRRALEDMMGRYGQN